MAPQRLDAALVRRGLARSRQHAVELVTAGRVSVAGQPASRPALAVPDGAPIDVLSSTGPEYVSRAGHKLAGALDALAGRGAAPAVAGRRCLDAGASTGGFTDVLLRRGAASVVAVDVGRGQLDRGLAKDPRVRVVDGVNVRDLRPEQVTPAPGLVVADLSFISLTIALPALAGCAAAEADLLPMVKPQFEVGRGRLGRGGVVHEAAERQRAITAVLKSADALGLACLDVVASPLPGPSGNVEYFAWLRRAAPGGPAATVDLAALAARAVAEGPR